MKSVPLKIYLLSHRDIHLPAPAATFPSIKMKAMQFQTGFHCPESLFTIVLQLATSMASNKAVQSKSEGTKDGGLARMGCSFISGHVSNPCPRQWLVKHPRR